MNWKKISIRKTQKMIRLSGIYLVVKVRDLYRIPLLFAIVP